MVTKDERLYQIACSFRALQFKGVEQGNIPGITPTVFYDVELADYLYKGRGGALSRGEFILLEFLLNLYSPDIYNKFNFGDALYVLDPCHMQAVIKGASRVYNNK